MDDDYRAAWHCVRFLARPGMAGADWRGFDAVQESVGHGAVRLGVFQCHRFDPPQVTAGVIALIVVGLRYKGGRYNADDLEVVGLYWHFVDLVWMFVVPFVYLLNLAH